MTTLENYRFSCPIAVRFADLDVLGHLNNAKYLTYAEQARILYIREVVGWQGKWNTLGMILARTEIDYKLPIAFEDTVKAYVCVSRLGGKSFDMTYSLTRQKADNTPQIAAEIKTVMVTYDYNADTTIAIPDSWRQRITAYEPNL